MEKIKVNNNIFFIAQPFDIGVVGVTVILGTDEVGLVDSGLETTPKEFIFPLLRSLGQRPENISVVANTHFHFDHTGGNQVIKEVSGAKIAVHRLEPNVSRDIDLEEGDILKLGDRNFRVIHTPGHTPGSICLYNKEISLLITGDSVPDKGIRGRKKIPKKHRPNEPYLSSMKKLLNIEVETMIMGHMKEPFGKCILKGSEPKKMLLESIKIVENLTS